MTDTAKEELQAALMLLRNVLVKNRMSIGATKDKEIMFFDTDRYVQSGVFDGFVVKMDSLVK